MSKVSETAQSKRYDLDRPVERRGTNSAKWSRYDPDVLPLWVADMDFRSPDLVVQALRERVEHGVFGYGIEPPELRGLMVERLESRFGWRISPDDMILLPGVVVGFNLAAHAAARPGEGYLIQPPVYPPFFVIARNTGRVAAQAPLMRSDNSWEVDFDAFERAITPRTKLFLLCNPHNPVGRVFRRDELERLAEICLRHDLIICSDEIHQDFVYEGSRHIPFATLSPEVAERTITLFSPSKTYNIAGFHFSAVAATNPQLRERVRKAASGLIPHTPGILDLVAAVAAYRDESGWLEQVLAYLRGNRDYLLDYVEVNLPGVSTTVPEGTYLAWLDCREANLGEQPGDFFLREARVALSEGAAFGAPGAGFVRLNFGCPRSVLAEALERMRLALERRQK